MAFFVVSERGYSDHVAWGVTYEFEDIIARACNAQILAPRRGSLKRIHWKWDIIFNRWRPLLKMKDFSFPRAGAGEKNVLLLIGMGPGALAMLETLPRWREDNEIVAAYILDVYQAGITALASKKLRRITDRIDHLFVSYEQAVPRIQPVCKAPVSLLLQAADVLAHGAHGGDRPIDVISYGRRFKETHTALQRAFNYPQSPRLYFHSTFSFTDYPRVDDYREDRQLFFQLLRRSKIALNYRFTQTTAGLSHGICPLTARWFECVAAGTVICGTKPTGPEAQREFDWPDAVIEFPEANPDPVGTVNAVLADTDRLARVSRMNYLQALCRHDWRYRLREMLQTLKLPILQALQQDLDALQVKATALQQTSGGAAPTSPQAVSA